jgi:hypothetical protein
MLRATFAKPRLWEPHTNSAKVDGKLPIPYVGSTLAAMSLPAFH